LIPDNEDSDAKAERMDASGEDTSASKPDKAITDEGTDSESESRIEAAQKATAKQSRINRELKKRTEEMGLFIQSNRDGKTIGYQD
jgi:hypothetical protein